MARRCFLGERLHAPTAATVELWGCAQTDAASDPHRRDAVQTRHRDAVGRVVRGSSPGEAAT